jgi:hypothetical protein
MPVKATSDAWFAPVPLTIGERGGHAPDQLDRALWTWATSPPLRALAAASNWDWPADKTALGLLLSLAAVRDLRVARAPATAEDLAALETDALAGFVLARAAAGLSDGTIASDVLHLEQVRAWFGRPLWDMEPPDADAYFGKVLRGTAKGTRLSRAQALKTYFLFLELRHKVEIHQMTGRIVECPIDEMNRPRGRQQAKLRIPPAAAQVDRLFAGWREELATCRKFAPAARNYTACRLLSEVGLRVNEEACKLDLPDIKWDLGRFGKLHVRHGKGRPRVRAP